MISFVLVLVPSMVNVYSISFVHIARSLVVVRVFDIVIVLNITLVLVYRLHSCIACSCSCSR